MTVKLVGYLNNVQQSEKQNIIVALGLFKVKPSTFNIDIFVSFLYHHVQTTFHHKIWTSLTLEETLIQVCAIPSQKIFCLRIKVNYILKWILFCQSQFQSPSGWEQELVGIKLSCQPQMIFVIDLTSQVSSFISEMFEVKKIEPVFNSFLALHAIFNCPCW